MWPTVGLPLKYYPLITCLLTAVQIFLFVQVDDTVRNLGLPMQTSTTEPWRSATYMLAHSDTPHLVSNMALQLCIGFLVEGVHGHVRTLAVYVASGVGGAYVFRAVWCVSQAPPTVLVGASGAIYGLLGAFCSHLLLNWAEVIMRWLWLAAASLVLISDVLMYVLFPQPRVAYSAHAGGALFGLCWGVLLLRNIRVLRHERALYAIACVAIVAMTLACLLVC